MPDRYREETLELRTGSVHLLCGGKGDPVVVLHHSTGNPGWIPFYDELAKRFSVTVPDLPGYGQSPSPLWAREPADLAVLVSRVIDRLDLEEVALVGLGLGGFVAAELAVRNPSRLASLVLVGAAGLRPEQGEIADQMLIGHRAYLRQSFRDDAAHDAAFGEEPAGELQELWDHSRVMTARICWKPYMWSPTLPPLLQDLEVPTLLVWGERDRIVPRVCGEQYQRLLPNAALEVVPEGGHLIEFEEPERVARLIEAHRRKVPAAAR